MPLCRASEMMREKRREREVKDEGEITSDMSVQGEARRGEKEECNEFTVGEGGRREKSKKTRNDAR